MDYKPFKVSLDLARENRQAIRPVQGESAAKIIYTLIHNSAPYSLAGTTVIAKYRKKDGTVSFLPGVITDASAGEVEVTLTNQVLLFSGTVVAIVEVTGDAGIAKSFIHTLDVQPGVEDTSIESVNEYPAIDQAMIDIQSIRNDFDLIVAGLTIDSEVILARGTHDNLKQRLDASDTDIGYAEGRLDIAESDIDEIVDAIADIENEIEEIDRALKYTKIESWADVQKVVRDGVADKIFSVGDQFTAKYNGVDYLWDVIGINHDEPADPQRVYSMTIQSRDCLMNCVFDASELLYFAEEVLPVGDYNFYDNYNSRNYAFSVAIPIPAGGSINVSVWGATNNPTSVQTKDVANVTIETIPVVESSEGTLIICNDLRRVRYGSNNYLEANIRSWLNSDTPVYAGTKKTKYDVLSTGAPYNGAGFLYNLDPELKSVIGPVKKQVAKNTITDGGGQDLFVDTAFLISRVEAFGGGEGVVTGEKPYEYYNLLGPVATTAELAGRIKYLSGVSRHWWLRSPGVGYSYYPRIVLTPGAIYGNIASYAGGLAPACTIY